LVEAAFFDFVRGMSREDWAKSKTEYYLHTVRFFR
jgi:hypothetical protein